MKAQLHDELDPLAFIEELREAHSDSYKLFTEGCCYRLCVMLCLIFHDAEALYSEKDGHWITRIGDRYYDIGGELMPGHVREADYEPRGRQSHAGAWLANDGRTASYAKYLRTSVNR